MLQSHFPQSCLHILMRCSFIQIHFGFYLVSQDGWERIFEEETQIADLMSLNETLMKTIIEFRQQITMCGPLACMTY